jgi:starch phosphorylase
MLLDYTRDFYDPCIDRVRRIKQSGFEPLRILSSFKQNIRSSWPDVRIIADSNQYSLPEHSVKSGESIMLNARVYLGSLSPDDAAVEVYYGPVVNNQIRHGETAEMSVVKQADSSSFYYSVNLSIAEGGEYGYTFRVIPKHKELFNKHDIPFIKWANT